MGKITRTLATGALSAVMAMYAIGCGDSDVDKAKKLLKQGKTEAAAKLLQDSKSDSAERFYLEGVAELKKGVGNLSELLKNYYRIDERKDGFDLSRDVVSEVENRLNSTESRVQDFFNKAISLDAKYNGMIQEAYSDAGYVIKDGKPCKKVSDASTPSNALKSLFWACLANDTETLDKCLIKPDLESLSKERNVELYLRRPGSSRSERIVTSEYDMHKEHWNGRMAVLSRMPKQFKDAIIIGDSVIKGDKGFVPFYVTYIEQRGGGIGLFKVEKTEEGWQLEYALRRLNTKLETAKPN